MKNDKVKLYFFEIIVLILLFIALFVSSKISRFFLSILLLIFAVVARTLFQKKRILRTSSREVMYLMIGLGVLYVGIFYLFGLFFYHFNKQMLVFGYRTIINFIIPFIIIILTSEELRFTLLSQDGKIRIRNTSYDFSKILVFIIMVLIDLIIYVGVYNLERLDDFLALVGFISFASISCNLFYNYYSKRFGILGIIFYRMITILYVYIIPVIPNMYIYFRSFLRMLYPYLMYILLENTFGKRVFVESYRVRRRNALFVTIIIVFMTFLTMLVSCQFRYGMLVVGSGSMTGTINKGDVTIFESYHNQEIRKGDIVIFRYKDIQMVYRVIDIKNVNNEMHYYTKGDVNRDADSDYRISSDIVGISKLRIRYVGVPTLWLHSLFHF